MNARNIKGSKFALSWWVFLTIIPGLTFIPFLYAGFSSKDRKLVYFAYLYFIPLILGYYVNAIYLVGYIGGMVHAFLIRDKYIQRRMELKMNKLNNHHNYYEKDKNIKNNVSKKEVVKMKIEEDVQREVDPQDISKIEKTTATKKVIEKENSTRELDLGKASEVLVDINHCSEEEFAKLPFINAIMAKKAMEKREAIGSFSSVEEFGISIGLKPHVIEKIRPLVIIKEKERKEEKKENRRVIDL